MKCKGCGVILQNSDPNKIGYIKKIGQEYCQRCFRLTHYGDLMYSMKQGIPSDQVIREINQLEGLVLWVVDLFDFEAGLIEGLSRKLLDKNIVMVLTKRDLLPHDISIDKIEKLVQTRLKEYGIYPKYCFITSLNDSESLDEIKKYVKENAINQTCIVMGKANAGKSTFINHLLNESVLTTSVYPGTTLELNTLQIEGMTYIDTPGIEVEHSMLMEVDEKDLKEIIPHSTIKPQIYQIFENRSFTIGGLVTLEFTGVEKGSVVFYISNQLNIHHTKPEQQAKLWEKHYGTLFQPIPIHGQFVSKSIKKEDGKIDIVIDGLGWICISGKIKNITVKVVKNVNVTFRKAVF